MNWLWATLAAIAVLYSTMTPAADTAQTKPVTSAGTRFRDCPECPELIVIPPGRFTMSRKSASDGRRDDDPEGIPKSAPAREVRFSDPIALGVYDVTREEFGTFVRETGRSSQAGCYVWKRGNWVDDRSKSWFNPGFQQTPRDPVVCVNWEDAQAYVHWLNEKLSSERSKQILIGGLYRLPSWEEQEYAARAGTTTPYYWGTETNHDRANYGDEHCFPCMPIRQGADQWLYTSPVGSFPPNPFGLYDMAGNVWQWTGNCVRGSLSGLQSEPIESKSPCTTSALHGGSWLEDDQHLRSGEYALDRRINRNQEIGFRVARTLVNIVGADPSSAPFQPNAAVSASTVQTDPAPSGPGMPGKTFHDCPDCPEMIVIPEGSFTMGSPPTGHTWDTRDLPEHRVIFAKPFALSIYDVTRAQYKMFVEDTHRTGGKGCDVVDPEARWITDPSRDWRDPAFRQTERDPVVCVSWEDAQAYIQWLNSRVNRHGQATLQVRGLYRLPSEAEWEYAARAGNTAPYYWGSSANHNAANYGLEQCYPCGVEKSGKDRWFFTSPVGSFAPNAFGLYDMSGNVWQWTQDCMHYGYEGAPEDGSVWVGGECKLRVLRGGSWLDPGVLITVTLRNPWSPHSRNNANGFRLARSLN